MSFQLGLKPLQKCGVIVLGWWLSNAIIEFCFGPNLRLRLEAGTKLNKDRVKILGLYGTKLKIGKTGLGG